MESELKPIVITVAGAVVRGRARQYRYVEPVVCELYRMKSRPMVTFRHLSRPCRARRSDRLAYQDAMALAAQYRAAGHLVFLLDTYGSQHFKPVPEAVKIELLQHPTWNTFFPSHPEIAREFLV